MKFQRHNLLNNQLIHHWWVILVGGIIGGLVAFILSRLVFLPIYVTQAEFSVSINFKQVGDLEQYEQDQLFGNVISLFQTSEVIEKTIQKTGDSSLSESDFRNACFIERQMNLILFRCKSTLPDKSVNWANAWAEVSHQFLSDAYTHVLNYELLKKKQNSFESCVQRSYFTYPSPVDCSLIFPEETSREMTKLIQEEFLLSKNIYSGIIFSDVANAKIPLKPVRFQTNFLVLTGAIFGFIVSLLFVATFKNGKK